MAYSVSEIESFISQYRMTFDYHTHTTFSHGKGSIEDNVKVALSKGLKGLAISDHGPGHLTYGIKRSSLPVMRAEIDRLKSVYPEIELYLSVEANVLNRGNHIDVNAEDLRYLDFLHAGYHYGVLHGYCVKNWLDFRRAYPESRGKKLLIKNTEMCVKCIYENELKIFTHPGDKGRFDIDEIAKACEDRGTWLEINMKHPFLNDEGIKIASKYDVSFVISSDAHIPENVGLYEGGLGRAYVAGLDFDRIVNIEHI